MWYYIDYPQAAMSDLAAHVVAMRTRSRLRFSPDGLNVHLVWLPRVLSEFCHGLGVERRDNTKAPKHRIICASFLGGRPFPPPEGFKFPE